MLSSHEMEAMNPTSPKERMKQLIVISICGIAMLSYHLYDAGAFHDVHITQDVFTISSTAFIYKTIARDYLTSAGTMRSLSDDLLLQDYEFRKNQIYTIFLDNTKLIPTNYKRSIVGTIVEKNNDDRRMLLLSKNDDNANDDTSASASSDSNVYAEYKNDDDDKDGRSERFWNSINYNIGIIPEKTNVLKVSFRFTNGFLSSMIHFWKVVPKIVEYIKKEKNIVEPVIIYTCNSEEQICTFYSPLENMSQFHLNELDTNEYASTLIKEKKMEFKEDTTKSTQDDTNKETEL